MVKLGLSRSWKQLCSWNGWRTFSMACKKAWLTTIQWHGWKKLFCLPAHIVSVLFLLCCAALVYVFCNGLELEPWAYGLYALSAYSLTALCVRVILGLRHHSIRRKTHPKTEALLKNKDLLFRMKLYLAQIINFGYGTYKIAAGIILGSAWIGSDGIYNLAQALVQLFQILRGKNPGTMQQQWRSYRVCGILILLMHLTLIGIVFQMVNWHRAAESGEIMIIATAAFAFYKLITSFVNLAKDRKHPHPVDSSVRMLEFSQAIFAIFSLQAGLLHTFGAGESWEHWLNLAAGCAVCLLTVAMGIYMIHRANRELMTLQENEHGT